VEPAWKWPVASLDRERKVHDLVPENGLQRVVRIRADALREDRDVMKAGRQAHDPHGSGACAPIVFRNERDADLWRNVQPRTRERSRELPSIDMAHTISHRSQ
jgi:hypothetical protein